MKTTKHYHGHRWTTDELKQLMQRWADREPLADIAEALGVTQTAVLKMVQRLRTNGVPLERRTKGHIAGRSNKPWTQGEVEYLIRRRDEKATSEEIAIELGRTTNAVNSMIGQLRSQQVDVAMRGCGVRRLWNADALKVVTLQSPNLQLIVSDRKQGIA